MNPRWQNLSDAAPDQVQATMEARIKFLFFSWTSSTFPSLSSLPRLTFHWCLQHPDHRRAGSCLCECEDCWVMLGQKHGLCCSGANVSGCVSSPGPAFRCCRRHWPGDGPFGRWEATGLHRHRPHGAVSPGTMSQQKQAEWTKCMHVVHGQQHWWSFNFCCVRLWEVMWPAVWPLVRHVLVSNGWW